MLIFILLNIHLFSYSTTLKKKIPVCLVVYDNIFFKNSELANCKQHLCLSINIAANR